MVAYFCSVQFLSSYLYALFRGHLPGVKASSCQTYMYWLLSDTPRALPTTDHFLALVLKDCKATSYWFFHLLMSKMASLFILLVKKDILYLCVFLYVFMDLILTA